MMEIASTSETSVNFYQTAWRYNPEDSLLYSRRRENLKSCSYIRVLTFLSFFVVGFSLPSFILFPCV
jgi:hypothetical protein